MSDPVKGAPTESGSPQGQVHRMVPVLPLRDIVVFPHSFLPLSVGRKSTIQMLRDATREAAEADPSGTGKVMLAVLTQKDDAVDHPGEDDLYRVGTAARLEKQVRMREGTVRIVIRGSFRFRVERIVQTEPYVRADIRVLDGTVGANKTVEFEALTRKIREELQEMIKTDLFPRAREVMKTQLARVGSAGQLADFVAEQLPSLNTEMRQEILQTLSIEDRLGLAYAAILREKQVRDLGRSIESKVKSEVGRTQREFFLREQMKAIQKELGEGDDSTKEMDELREKIEKAGMPEEAEKEALREFRRLGRIPPASAEYTVGRTYLDWLVRVPWDKRTEDKYDIPRAKDILEADHYDLEKVKDRILEFLAVRERKPDQKGPILCFAGPPGVGKTSLGRSIAKAVGREFVRLSLGGIRDEAEIRGHRRTYIGALPGQIIQGLVRAGTRNPVFMLDEVDKLGMDFRGDPSSALLEVLDPEQNDTFRDHYLDLAFDLSDVLFIATANMMDPVPPALKDRMEILHLQGYTEEEKIQIATRHLIPRQLENHGPRRRGRPAGLRPRGARAHHPGLHPGGRTPQHGAVHREDLPQGGPEARRGRGGPAPGHAGSGERPARGADLTVERAGGARQRAGSGRGTRVDAHWRRSPLRRSVPHEGEHAADPDRPARRRDEGVGDRRPLLGPGARRRLRNPDGLLPEVGHPLPRAGRLHAEGRPLGGDHAGRGADLGPDRNHVPARTGDDRGDHPDRPCASRRRDQGEAARGASLRDQGSDPAAAERGGSPRGRAGRDPGRAADPPGLQSRGNHPDHLPGPRSRPRPSARVPNPTACRCISAVFPAKLRRRLPPS